MDNKKIGKLIAQLRNDKKLTQQELGDKVGVGFRAVSKWERGITMPDIGIINELSKILGITSDELLSGELKENKEIQRKNNISFKTKITILATTIISLLILTIIIYYNNKTYVYNMSSINKDKYYVEGQVTFKENNISIILTKLDFVDMNLDSMNVNDYEYEIYTNNNFVFGYGNGQDAKIIETEQTIKEFADTFKINYNGKLNLKREDVLNNNIEIIIRMWDTKSNEITEKIEIALYK